MVRGRHGHCLWPSLSNPTFLGLLEVRHGMKPLRLQESYNTTTFITVSLMQIRHALCEATVQQHRIKTVTFVSPATGATLHTFLARSELMMELLPTFG